MIRAVRDRLQSYFRAHPLAAVLVAAAIIAVVWTMDAVRAWAAHGRWSPAEWLTTVGAAAVAGALALPLLAAVMRPSLRYDDMASGSLGPMSAVAAGVWFVPFAASHHRSGVNDAFDNLWVLAAAVFSDVFLVVCAVAAVWVSRRYLMERSLSRD